MHGAETLVSRTVRILRRASVHTRDHTVEEDRELLCCLQAVVEQRGVQDHLLHDELIDGHEADAVGQLIKPLVGMDFSERRKSGAGECVDMLVVCVCVCVQMQ